MMCEWGARFCCYDHFLRSLALCPTFRYFCCFVFCLLTFWVNCPDLVISHPTPFTRAKRKIWKFSLLWTMSQWEVQIGSNTAEKTSRENQPINTSSSLLCSGLFPSSSNVSTSTVLSSSSTSSDLVESSFSSSSSFSFSSISSPGSLDNFSTETLSPFDFSSFDYDVDIDIGVFFLLFWFRFFWGSPRFERILITSSPFS